MSNLDIDNVSLSDSQVIDVFLFAVTVQEVKNKPKCQKIRWKKENSMKV